MLSRPETRCVFSTTAKVAALRRHPLFGGLPLKHIERLSIYASTRAYPRGATIFGKGDPGTSLFAVCTGTVRIGVSSRDGREAVFNLVKQGEVFGEIALLDGRPRTATATAMTDCELMVIDRDNFVSLVENQPEIALKLIGVLCTRLRHTSEQVEDILFGDLAERLAKVLLRLTRHAEFEVSGSNGRILMTQREIGQMIGSSRESINKQMQEWKERNWIRIERGSIMVLAPEALAAIATPTIDL
jgi:CRP/FNR family transcriptional regulator, cyclic AMP receptor protein